MTANAIIAAPIATPNAIVTIRPEVVRESSFFMHTSALALAEKQISPGAHEADSTVVALQVDVPDVVTQTEVDFVDVMEQIKEVDVPSDVSMISWFKDHSTNLLCWQ